jgi:hypothetical protein
MFGHISKSRTPATIALVATNVIAFFFIASTHSVALLTWLGFTDPLWLTRPWTFVTWPLVGMYHPVNLLFGSMWALVVCGSLERSWGTKLFLAFMAAVSALTALTLLIGGRLLDSPAVLSGLLIGVAAPTAAWCAVNRFQKICFWGFPIPSPLIALFVAILVWFEQGTPLRGLFALSGMAVGWYYGMYGRFLYRGYARNPASPFDRFSTKQKPALRMVDIENDIRPGAPMLDRYNPMRMYRSWRTRRAVEKLIRRGSGTDPRDR